MKSTPVNATLKSGKGLVLIGWLDQRTVMSDVVSESGGLFRTWIAVQNIIGETDAVERILGACPKKAAKAPALHPIITPVLRKKKEEKPKLGRRKTKTEMLASFTDSTEAGFGAFE